MKKVFIVIIFFTILFACKKNNDEKTIKSNNGIEIQYDGDMESESGTGRFVGSFEIKPNGDFSLEDMTGSMKGNAILESSKYSIKVNETKGYFEHISSINGEYLLDSKEFILNAKDINDSDVSFEADGITVGEHNQQWRDSRLKSAVYFTHFHSCEATITVGSDELEPIGSHWVEDGYCGTEYEVWRTITNNYDDMYSETFCATGTLEGIDGNPVEFEDCYTAMFVLNKNTNYNYSVVWSNGNTSSGNFTTADGGGKKTICIDNDGMECENGELIRILGNTLEIDKSNSDLDYTSPSGDIEFNFNKSDYSIRVENSVWIGTPVTSPFSYIRFNDPTGLKQKVYNLDNDDVVLQVVISGDKSIPFTNDFIIMPNIHNANSKGTVEITKLDYENEELTLVFSNVIVELRIFFGTTTVVDHIRFSGTVIGNFYNFE